METFSILKYWRNSAPGSAPGSNTANPRASTNTIITASATVSPYSSDSEDGSFFDLEFFHPDDKEKIQNKENETTEEEEIELCVENENVTISPTNEIFFKDGLISVEHSSSLLNDLEETHKFPVSLLKSATKFGVFLLKLKKSQSGNGVLAKTTEHETNSTQKVPNSRIQDKQGKHSGKFFTVKVEEAKAPVICEDCKGIKNDIEDLDSNATSDEKKLTKKVVKYLEMVKPLYVRVEKLKFSGHLSFIGGDSPPCAVAEKGGEMSTSCVKTNLKQGNNNLQAGLNVLRKHLGKSRSTSATAEALPPSWKMGCDRRDDSLLQLHDGIQGAILHCKKSFNASRDRESGSLLCRSVSDPSYEKFVMMPMVSSASTSSYSGKAKEIKA